MGKIEIGSVKESENIWRNEWRYKIMFSSYTQRKFIIIDAKLQGNRVTLVLVYGPNRDDPTFYQSLQSKIEMIGNTSVIIGGDSNVPLNYEIDTEKYLNKNKPKAQQKVHALMADLDLIDVWQKNNPSVKSYTWRSPNSKRSRLDCF